MDGLESFRRMARISSVEQLEEFLKELKSQETVHPRDLKRIGKRIAIVEEELKSRKT